MDNQHQHDYSVEASELQRQQYGANPVVPVPPVIFPPIIGPGPIVPWGQPYPPGPWVPGQGGPIPPGYVPAPPPWGYQGQPLMQPIPTPAVPREDGQEFDTSDQFYSESFNEPRPMPGPGPGPGPWGPGHGPGPWGPGHGPGPWGPGHGPGPWGPGPGPGPWGPGPWGPFGPLFPIPFLFGGPRHEFIFIEIDGGDTFPNATATYQLRYQPGVTVFDAINSVDAVQLTTRGDISIISGIVIDGNVNYTLSLNGQPITNSSINHQLQPNDQLGIHLIYV